MKSARTARTDGAANRLPSLDGLRAVAILLVIWEHSHAIVAGQPWADALTRLVPSGSFGVQLFFVLSGFLITTLILRERGKVGRLDLKDFYVRRAYRILPAFYVFLAVVLLLTLTNQIQLQWWVIGASALFVRDYTPTGGSWWLGHTWTLSVEEQFYLLWPLLFVWLSGRRARHLLVAVVLLSPLVRLATWYFVPPVREGIEVMFHTRADGLAVGCLLALVWVEPWFEPRARLALRRGAGWAAIVWIALSAQMQYIHGDAWKFSLGYVGDAIAIAVVLTWMVLRPHTLGGKTLNLRPVAFIGAISYSLYLWQQLFVTPRNLLTGDSLPLAVAAAFVAAIASYHLVERPFLSLRNRRSAQVERVLGSEHPDATRR